MGGFILIMGLNIWSLPIFYCILESIKFNLKNKKPIPRIFLIDLFSTSIHFCRTILKAYDLNSSRTA
ncbi:hypothetical protein HRM2_27450 [Desulforapulum autotrophicum HRM2]|uniref:Uncharacterized protein n=1 Tax=Desulforapulum autotrophicum (strain ATCC 43914 / DSM 3382 / VKM B-1955 / HRM2) TaxID=177437 RepID=C0QIA1_DESAH|nr:hypothetical protein HRM2_27450 [Desulforapulum autotrophicum HRM2]